MVITTHWLRKFFARTLWQHCKRGFVVLSLAILLVPLFSYTRVLPHTRNGHATALTNSTLNFQARLQTSAGAIAPDGYYHVEFKLYDALTGGTLLWTETRTTGNLVRVAHGYLTVDLGSVTNFPSTIPWDQQLYLTMNIGGTAGSPTWDGEMSPRLKLTAVPYAFNAKTASQLATSNGGFLSTLSIANPTGGNQTFQIQDQGAAGTYNLLTENQINAGYIQNQGVGVQTTSQFWISDAGRSDTSFLAPLFDTPDASALNIGTTNATSISLNQSTTIAANKNITFTAGTGSFDQSSSTGSFSTGSGVVLLNGNTTVATGKNLTVTNGTTSLTGTTNINTTGAATTTLGNSGATNAIAGTTTVTGTTNVNTTGTAATTIGSATGGAVNISANAASSFTTATGALTLTSAAAATWGTNAGALTLQGFGGTTVTSTAGTSSSNVTIASGNASAGASGNITIDTGTASTTAGTVSIGTTNASAVTIGRVGTTTTIQGTTAVTPQASTSTTLLCSNSGVISTCDASVVSPTAANFIQNQATTPGTAQTGNFNINGTGIADTLQGTTKVLTATLDAVTAATALNLGTTNASVINLNQSTTLAANKNITFAAGTGNFDQSASTGTFATGTGAVSLNGDTTVVSGKNFTVTNGTTSLTGPTNINTTGTAATTIGSASGGAVNVTANAASTITTTSGNALTLNSGAAALWGTTAGLLTIQGAAGVNVQSTSGAATSAVWIQSGNASAGASGNVVIDAGSATTTVGTINIGTTNATTINVATNAVAHTVNIATGGAAQTLTLGSLNTTSTTTVQSGTGGIALNSGAGAITLNGNTSTASGKSLTVNGVQLVKSPVGQDSTTAFQIQNSLGTSVLNASTAEGAVLTLGGGTGGVGWVGRVAAGAYYVSGLGPGSRTATVMKAIPAGHTLIGSLNTNALASAPVLTVSDTKGNTYQIDVALDDSPNNSNETYLFSSRITNALTVGDTITLSLGGSTRIRWAWDIEEFDNIVASNWLDQTSVNNNNGVTATTGTSATTTQSTELVFGAFGYVSGSFSPASGFVSSPQQKTAAGSSDRALSNEWKFVTATGTQVATANLTTARDYNGLLATYKTTGAITSVQGTIALADGNGYTAKFVPMTMTGDQIYMLSDESGTICLQGSANCGFILTNSDAITIGTPTNPTVVQKVAQTTNNTAGADLTVQGATGNGTGTGGTVTIKGGTGGATNANGGTLVLSGGDAGGTGKMGLVSLNPTVFAASGVQTLGTTQTLTQSWIDSYSTLPLVASAPSLTFTVPAPSINTVGRVFYLSNAGVSGTGNDFSISLAGTGISINLKPNSTATLIWNGNGWTAAGASSATDLQAAYNNTQTSAGGAEIVLNPIGGAADGLTIRNNGTTPIVGGLFEVQSNIGTNLFSVNNQGAELAANGGAETITNFGTNWTALGGTTITQSNTTYATGKYSVDVTQPAGGAANRGVINNLSANPAVSTTYTVSFTAKVSSGTPTLNVYYSYNGGGAQTPCTMYGSYQTANTTQWSKVTCRITTPANAVTNPDLVIYTSDAIGATRELYIDNLSFVQNDANTIPSNVQMGGGVNGGQVTLFTLDRSSVPPLVANGDSRYLGSMYYDTTLGNIQCYELDGWGACGSAPDNIITLTPEYTGAVLNGTGVGTMTADFCGNGGGLTVNTGFCASGEARNYYRWTSPQATDQAYSIYVSYKLPSTFKEFVAGTTSLTSLVDNTSNASVKYAIFKKNSAGGLVSCSADATMTGTVSTWNSTVPTVDLGTGACHTGGATPFAAGDTVVIRITVSAKSNANAYVENLTFRYSNK